MNNKNYIVSTDHLGQVFPSFQAMCDHHNLQAQTVKLRLERGMTIEQALAPVTITYKGRVYHSLRHLCEVHGVNVNTVRARLKKMPLEQALQNKHFGHYSSKIVVKGTVFTVTKETLTYKGFTYKNIQQLCRSLDIKAGSFKYLIVKKNYTTEQAVEHLINFAKPYSVGDNEFKTLKEIAELYQLSVPTVHKCVKATENRFARQELLRMAKKHSQELKQKK